MLEFWNTTQPKAKKDYQCDLCNQKIHKGEKYNRYSGKYNGQMFDDKYHLACQRIIKAYCDAMDDREYDEDSIQEWLYDTHCLDCKHYENDDCTFLELCCPHIRKHYESKAGEQMETSNFCIEGYIEIVDPEEVELMMQQEDKQ